MKQLIKKIVVFVLPVLLVLTVVFLIKANREFCYNYIKGDCDARGKLFYKKLFSDCNNVDYLFIGSSKTMNGINDGLIEDSLNTGDTVFLHLYNAGYCRFGRNMDFLLCKEFAKENKLKKIFLEVRADESTTSHPIYPYLANGKEILTGALALNTKIFPEIYNHLLMNISYLRSQFKLSKAEKNVEAFQLHGYNNIDKVLGEELLEKYYQEEIIKLGNNAININAFEYKYSNFYLKRIKSLCQKNNIELEFVYLPSFGNVSKEPAFLSEYKKWGKVIIGPDSIFTNTKYWKDVAHFNTAGATAYSKYLTTVLTR